MSVLVVIVVGLLLKNLDEVTHNMGIYWAGPPPTNSGILGIYKDLNIITIISRGHY